MARHLLALVITDGHKLAFCIRDIGPLDDVFLGVGHTLIVLVEAFVARPKIVRLSAKALPIEQEFHFLAVAESVDGLYGAYFLVPVLVETQTTDLHVVPIDALPFSSVYSDANQWFIRHESTLDEIGCRIRIEGGVEEGVVPTLLGPLVRLTPVFDCTPIGKTYHLLAIHIEESPKELRRLALALEENHVGVMLQILIVAVALVVERRNLADLCQFRSDTMLHITAVGFTAKGTSS